jgi:hypothetical protein
MTENELNLIPYFTRLIIVDRVGFEPTTCGFEDLSSLLE